MKTSKNILNLFVTALFFATAAFADTSTSSPKLDALFERLQAPELPEWEEVEADIWEEWSQSGSPSMDLLLERGREAMSDGNLEEAVEHLTALTDHAPEFAEGWNARATAFFTMERYGLSISDIQRTLALNPRHFGAMQGLGRILEEIEDYPAALDAYQAAYAIHPHRPGLEDAITRLELLVAGQTL